MSEDQASHQQPKLGPKCTSDCLTLGHSDACWFTSSKIAFASTKQIIDKYGSLPTRNNHNCHRISSGSNGTMPSRTAPPYANSSSSNEIEITPEMMVSKLYQAQ